MVSRLAHNQKIASSTLAPATNFMTTKELLTEQKNLRASIFATNDVIAKSSLQLTSLISQLKDIEDQLVISEVGDQIIITKTVGNRITDASQGTSAR